MDLTANRVGNTVELRFTVPSQTSDDQPLRARLVNASLCRQEKPNRPCLLVDTEETRIPLQVSETSGHAASPVVWTDMLPSALSAGAVRPLFYRIALRDARGRSAGFSDPVTVAAGSAPPPVTGFQAEGTRRGIALLWTAAPDADAVLIQRTDTTVTGATPSGSQAGTSHTAQAHAMQRTQASASAPARKMADPPGTVWLQAAPEDAGTSAMVDGTVTEAVPYRYVAIRQRILHVGGHTLQLRSAPSLAATATWHDVYPPAAPRGLSVLGYTLPNEAGEQQVQAKRRYAVDLIWQPVEDTRLSGYLVYRQELDTHGGQGRKVRLTPQPIATPGFHDGVAMPDARYRYSVSAIDPKGNESPAVEAVVEPLQ